MSNVWAESLKAAGMNDAASLGERGACVAADSDKNPQLVAMPSLCVVDITGEDARSFLQGQFSNDLAKVSPARVQITGYCTPKGRLLALPVIVGLDEGYRLLIPADIREGFLKRLSMFIMRAKVTVSEQQGWSCTGVLASASGELGPLSDFFGKLPENVMDVTSDAGGQVLRWHDAAGSVSRARYLFIADNSQQVALWRQGAPLPRSGQALWRLADIRAGIPSISSGVLEAFVPQMLNLQLVDGLSFTKGCYPGQEIVARMQYLGKLKRHMRRFSLPHEIAQDIPLPGDALLAGADEDAGRVVDAVAGPDGQVELLAVVKVSTTGSTLMFKGRELTAQELPYELPSLVEASLDAG